MKHKLEGKGHNFVYYSAHDGLILAIISALKLQVDVPPYASHFTFELFENEKGSYVNTRYNEAPLKVLGCEEDCPFDKFSELLLSIGKEFPFGTSCTPEEAREKESHFAPTDIIV